MRAEDSKQGQRVRVTEGEQGETMTTEQLDIVTKVLNATFPNMKASIECEVIIVDSWSIRETEIDAPRIGGTVKVPAYVLEVGVPTYGSDIEPPGVDVCEVACHRIFPNVVLALVAEIAKMRASDAIETLATEAMVQEWEQTERDLNDYHANKE